MDEICTYGHSKKYHEWHYPHKKKNGESVDKVKLGKCSECACRYFLGSGKRLTGRKVTNKPRKKSKRKENNMPRGRQKKKFSKYAQEQLEKIKKRYETTSFEVEFLIEDAEAIEKLCEETGIEVQAFLELAARKELERWKDGAA